MYRCSATSAPPFDAGYHCTITLFETERTASGSFLTKTEDHIYCDSSSVCRNYLTSIRIHTPDPDFFRHVLASVLSGIGHKIRDLYVRFRVRIPHKPGKCGIQFFPLTVRNIPNAVRQSCGLLYRPLESRQGSERRELCCPLYVWHMRVGHRHMMRQVYYIIVGSCHTFSPIMPYDRRSEAVSTCRLR